MANKLRIYELAKKHNKTTKDMLSLLKEEFGLKIKSHMSVLSGDELDIVEEYFSEDAKKSESQAKDNLKEDKKEEKKPKNIEKKSNKKEENISEKKSSNKKNKKSSNKKEKKKNKKQKLKIMTMEIFIFLNQFQ